MRKYLRGLAFATLVFVLACFPFGPLFAWSPWKPGYDHQRLALADIYFPSGTALPAAYLESDRSIAEAEAFHGLKAPKRIRIVVCKSWSDYERFSPWSRGRGIGAVTLATGTLIFITPKLDERKHDHGEFLRHELSHAVVHQNQRLPDAIDVIAAQWLYEGMAVWFGRQKSYKSREEFLDYVKDKDAVTLIDPQRRDSNFDIRMAYPAWRYFNEYLEIKYSRDKHREYLKTCMRAPKQWRELFPDIFGTDFADACARFQADLRDETFIPESTEASTTP